jgi:hypothetical protein
MNSWDHYVLNVQEILSISAPEEDIWSVEFDMVGSKKRMGTHHTRRPSPQVKY